MTTTEQKNKARRAANEWTYTTPRVDVTGDVFGRLTVESYHGSKHHSTYWNCKCQCGVKRVVRYSYLINKQVISCGCAKRSGADHPRWNGYEEITGTYLHNWRTNAASRNLNIDVTEEQLWKQFLLQNRRCALSGLKIGFDDHTASLDRIDSCLGYEEDNIQWLHKDVNKSKMDMVNELYITMCSNIALYRSPVILQRYDFGRFPDELRFVVSYYTEEYSSAHFAKFRRLNERRKNPCHCKTFFVECLARETGIWQTPKETDELISITECGLIKECPISPCVETIFSMEKVESDSQNTVIDFVQYERIAG